MQRLLPLPLRLTALALIGLLVAETGLAAEGVGRQALTTRLLKVCADPANLPFSDRSLAGFENKVINIVAEELGRDVRYTWYPQTTGFIRNTLRLRECDLISGITTTSERVQNTNPYYYSVYTMVYRRDSGLTATRMSDPQLADKRLGVVAGTPPADVLAAQGLLPQIKPYHLQTDTRHYKPVQQALDDVRNGRTDAAFIWGPIAGHYALSHPDDDIVVVPLLEEDKRVRLDFRVSMAVRYNETEWKRTINRVLKSRSADINEILRNYGVPLLNDRRELLLP